MNQLDAIQSLVSDNFLQLRDIWVKVCGTDETKSAERYQSVVTHISELFDDMIKEENEYVEEIIMNIENLKNVRNMLEMELNYKEDFSQNPVPLLEQERSLKQYIEKLSNLKNERLSLINELRAKEENLLNVLGKTNKFDQIVNIPCDNELDAFRNYLTNLQNEINKREVAVKILKTDVKDLMEELGLTPETEFEQKAIEHENLSVTDNDLDLLQKFKKKLLETRFNHEAEEKYLREKLNGLWNRLKVDSVEREEFLDRYRGIRKSTILALTNEVARCEEIRQKSMQAYIPQLRLELENMWDLCKLSQVERAKFKPYYSNVYVEETATALEKEIEKYTDFYYENQEIFLLADRRSTLLHDLSLLRNKANDPERLWKNRGGKLLQEEKERKRLLKDIPKIERELKLLLQTYENEKNQPFRYDGQNLLEIINEAIKQRNPKTEGKICTGSHENLFATGPSTPYPRVNLQRRKNENTPATPIYTQKLGKENKPTGARRVPIQTAPREIGSSYAVFEEHVKNDGSRSTPNSTMTSFLS